MKTLSKFFILFGFFFYVHLVVANTPHTSKKCSVAFTNLQSELEIQQFFANKANLDNFKNQEGYLRFCEVSGYKTMRYVFSNISKALDNKFKLLNWQVFDGSTQEFKDLSSHILDNQGNFKKEYKGMEGYAHFADKLYNGNMNKTFMNVSAVLDKRVFRQSGWQKFQGLTKEFRLLSSHILDNKGNFKKEYKGMEGQARFADKFYDGDMLKTFINVSAVLDKRVFRQSGWQVFNGLTQNFRALKTHILDNRGNFKKEYKGMEGYAHFADKFYNGDMLKTFINVSAVLDKRVFKQSGWKSFSGLTKEFKDLSSHILDNKGNFKKEYRGMEGYARFADKFYNGDMAKTFVNVSAVLDKRVFKQSGWQAFSGLTQEFRLLSSHILDNQGNFKEKYRGMEGQARFADEFYSGDMNKTFKNVSAVLDKRAFKQSGWQRFHGLTLEVRALRAKVLDAHGNFKKEYRGMEGYARFADEFYNGDMFKTFVNVSAMLDKRVFKQSGWQAFSGLTKEFKDLSSKVLDTQGNFKEEYHGMEGYAHFADTFYNGDMAKTFVNVSAVLDKRIFKQSDWKQFQGLTQEFRLLSSKVLDTQGNFKEAYKGMEGYAYFADTFYNGDMKKTFHNVSAVLDKQVFKQSGWQAFSGLTQVFRKLRENILDNRGNFKEKYRGMEGQAHFADEFYNGDMHKTFKNVSAVFGGFRNIKSLKWKAFYGTSSQYRELIQLFKDSSLEDLSDLSGQQKVANLIFNGHVWNTYRNVSALREILFVNPKEDWTALKWSRKMLPPP